MSEKKHHDPIPRDERYGTMAMAVLLLGVGILWVIASLQLESRVQDRYLTQAFLPTVAGALLALIGGLLLRQYLRRPSAPAEDLGQKSSMPDRNAAVRIAGAMGVLLAYIVILPSVHYLISTFACISAALALAGEPLRPRLFILAAVMSGIFFFVFVNLLGVALPGGRFG